MSVVKWISNVDDCGYGERLISWVVTSQSCGSRQDFKRGIFLVSVEYYSNDAGDGFG